ncbi:MAG: 50S ribosomal protein L18 [Bacteroidetes bacterium]|nr:MAG: 50S ribosomal protein L18 [Bacteroidota bacterium]
MNKLTLRRIKIKKRIRSRISGNSERPRLSVFRSNTEIYAQLIDDGSGKTIIASSSKEKALAKEKSKSKLEKAKSVGAAIAKKAVEKGIKEVVFDRNGFLYHGRVKALADGARENGLKF